MSEKSQAEKDKQEQVAQLQKKIADLKRLKALEQQISDLKKEHLKFEIAVEKYKKNTHNILLPQPWDNLHWGTTLSGRWIQYSGRLNSAGTLVSFVEKLSMRGNLQISDPFAYGASKFASYCKLQIGGESSTIRVGKTHLKKLSAEKEKEACISYIKTFMIADGDKWFDHCNGEIFEVDVATMNEKTHWQYIILEEHFSKEDDSAHSVATAVMSSEEASEMDDESREVLSCIREAELGNSWAQYNLGWRYANGSGVERSERKAVIWYRKAAEQGLAEAQCALGTCYAEERGVKKDKQQAAEWYRKAIAQRHARAQYCLSLITGDASEVDASQVFSWYRQSAVAGDINGQYSLGWSYANGWGTERDERQAVLWYQKAAERGHANAQHALGSCYANGKGVGKNERLAIEWYEKAAEQDHVVARNDLMLLRKATFA